MFKGTQVQIIREIKYKDENLLTLSGYKHSRFWSVSFFFLCITHLCIYLSDHIVYCFALNFFNLTNCILAFFLNKNALKIILRDFILNHHMDVQNWCSFSLMLYIIGCLIFLFPFIYKHFFGICDFCLRIDSQKWKDSLFFMLFLLIAVLFPESLLQFTLLLVVCESVPVLKFCGCHD